MAPPKRKAPRRTAAAVAEDLKRARMIGGLHRAVEDDLASTLDLLSLVGLPTDDEPLRRARDLLISHVRRGCKRHRQDHRKDPTACVAAASLRTLLVRPLADTHLAATIRSEAIGSAKHHITADAVRKREDKIIEEIARDVLADLEDQRDDEPRSLEAAIHNLVPVASDLRQQLHDLLCMTYGEVTPADPRERNVIEGFYRQTVIKLGNLLLASTRLAELGLAHPRMTDDDYFFVRHARWINGYLFDQAEGDHEYMRQFMRSHRSDSWEDQLVHLRATAEGSKIFERWLAWAKSCYPTCEFERSTDKLRMCSPHALITLLYDVEVKYLELGFSELDIAGNLPILHHRLAT